MRIILIALAVAVTAPAVAQEQQAGNEASANAEETFQALIDQCDEVDALTRRARIRLLISRTTDEAAKEAQTLLDQGFAQCGEGKMDEALATLDKAIEVADAGTETVFASEEPEPQPASATESEDDAPWWQFWK